MNVGDTFTQDFVISKQLYLGFIGLFNDNNPLHTNDEFATSKGFVSCVMHGNILNGFISYFVGECLPVKNVVIHTQEIRFTNPSYIDDHLMFEAKITDLVPAVNVVVIKFHFRNQENLKIANGKIQIGII